jgi:hypothetical protein
MIPLWRNKPVSVKNGTNEIQSLPVFASARQAITEAIRLQGMGRKSRIAIPEWSSQCVINAVAAFAMPIPLNEVLRHDIEVDGVLVYEQWGWGFCTNTYEQLFTKFKDSHFILDCVDSADIIQRSWLRDLSSSDRTSLVLSLSKILGLPGGGLLRINDRFIEPTTISEDDRTLSSYLYKLSLTSYGNTSTLNNKINHLMKSNISQIIPELEHWLECNNTFHSFEVERRARQDRIEIIHNSKLAKNWPEWMLQSIESGSGAGICPITFDFPSINKQLESLIRELNIEVRKLNFNWSGNPLFPDYREVLAVPCHGQVPLSDLYDLINNFEKIMT